MQDLAGKIAKYVCTCQLLKLISLVHLYQFVITLAIMVMSFLAALDA